MNSIKYMALDVHQSTISVAVLDAEGKLILQTILATQATAVLDLLRECVASCTSASKRERIRPGCMTCSRAVSQLVVCNPRKNALLKSGNKSDQIDARKLAELFRAGILSPVYHGEHSTQP